MEWIRPPVYLISISNHFVCDHLIIIEKETADEPKRSFGTYRMLCSQFTDRFYSETEFKIDAFLQVPGIKLELGRA